MINFKDLGFINETENVYFIVSQDGFKIYLIDSPNEVHMKIGNVGRPLTDDEKSKFISKFLLADWEFKK